MLFNTENGIKNQQLLRKQKKSYQAKANRNGIKK